MKYTLYIDESGEPGIGKIRTPLNNGASPYMTLGAVVIRDTDMIKIRKRLAETQRLMGISHLHCSKMNHYQITRYAQIASQLPLRFFGVISRKETLGSYRNAIANDHAKYYNKCVQYLLERVGFFMECRGIPQNDLNIIFEKANLNYRAMKNFILMCKANPIHPNTVRLQNINLANSQQKTKEEEPNLQLADLVAHALYKCVDTPPKQFGIVEPRYLKELSPRFFGHPDSNKIVGGGLYCVHSTNELNLDNEVKNMLDNLCSRPPVDPATQTS